MRRTLLLWGTPLGVEGRAAESAKSTNAAIGATELAETNYKTVNEIFLSTIAKANDEFTAQQAQVLFAVANQCPMLGGNAVFKARALYGLIDPEQEYDDQVLCLPFGIDVKRLVDPGTRALSIVPNPASDEATLVLTRALDEPGTLFICAALGGEVMRHAVPDGTSHFSFCTASLAPALYHYQVRGPLGIIGNGKLTIVR